MTQITEQQAYDMGAKGAPATEEERRLFEAWMRGHCWALSAEWRDGAYLGSAEDANYVCPHAMRTRQLWAAWRDRAALAAAPRAAINVERMESALSSESYDMPDGLSKEEQRQFILDKAAPRAALPEKVCPNNYGHPHDFSFYRDGKCLYCGTPSE